MRRTHRNPESCASPIRTRDYQAAEVPILNEALFALDLVLLHAAPLYYGVGIPHGDGSAVVLIPGFLCPDLYLTPLHEWLRRIGYKPVFSGIGVNSECPNLLITRQLTETIDRARAKSGRKVHLIGHSLGGVIARAIAAQRPRDVASVITLGAPFRGTVAHASILRAASMVRKRILARHGSAVLPDCYTARCTCDFLESLACVMPSPVLQTGLYRKRRRGGLALLQDGHPRNGLPRVRHPHWTRLQSFRILGYCEAPGTGSFQRYEGQRDEKILSVEADKSRSNAGFAGLNLSESAPALTNTGFLNGLGASANDLSGKAKGSAAVIFTKLRRPTLLMAVDMLLHTRETAT